MKLSDEMVAKLRKLAAEEPIEHDDLFGESPDDAYDKGIQDGRSDLASEILNSVKE